MTKQLISLELNELNFEIVDRYIEDGELKNFEKLFKDYSYVITESESEYEHLEPWIQWVTVHTGKTFKEHGIFRLGDIKSSDVEQIWEHLEKKGIRVGAMSPLNADNRLRHPTYFVPDPWTQSRVSGGWLLRKFYDAISQAVNDNASSRLTAKSVFYLLLGAARFASPINYKNYASLFLGARKSKWNRALFLDLLLADCFIKLQRKHQPQFTTLFLNAGAHIQHHYMFSSRFHTGEERNPSWYVAQGSDPVLEVYNLYDRIIGQMLTKFPDARLQLVTGLHQTVHPKTTFYWRLKNHDVFLRNLGLEFQAVEPRMSRDFLVKCGDNAASEKLAARLGLARSPGGDKIFAMDIRGDDVFVELVYDKEITPDFKYIFGNETRDDLFENTSFVAIKNGEHNGDGYFLDTGRVVGSPGKTGEKIPLTRLFHIVCDALAA